MRDKEETMPGPVVDPPVTPQQQVDAAAKVIMLRTPLHFDAARELATEVLGAVRDLMKPLPRCGDKNPDYAFTCNREPGHPPPHQAYGFDTTRPHKEW